MLHYEAFIRQSCKDRQNVCGDHTVAFSFKESYYYAIFDGIGSGVYANLAAIGTASRWSKMIREGISISEACEKIATDMNRARSQKIPFTAFVAAMVTRIGNALLYTYEAPRPVLKRDNVAHVLTPQLFAAGSEVLGEVIIELEEGDNLFLFSDGVSQSGLGRSRSLGWGEEGVASYIQQYGRELSPPDLLDALLHRCLNLSGGKCEDDTTILMIQTTKARHLSLFSGPPQWRGRDNDYAEAFNDARGTRIICGSTTSEVLARELGVRVRLLSKGEGLHSPPQYAMKGADLVTEGAIALNQTSNLLNADPNEITGETAPEKLARLLFNSDVIDIYEGLAANEAHEMLLFKQLGIHPRREAVRRLAIQLEDMGKMVHYHPF